MRMLDFRIIGEKIQQITRKWFSEMPPDEPVLSWNNEKPMWARPFSSIGIRFTPAYEKLNIAEGSPFSIGILIEHIPDYNPNLDSRISGIITNLAEIISGDWINSKCIPGIETGPDGPSEFDYHAFSIVFEEERLYNSSIY